MNNGIIEAIGGTLGINGTLTNPVGGEIFAGAGDKVLVSKGLATNAGLINLTSGTFDNNNHAMTNTGAITGYGTFRTGGLTTTGTIALAGGSSTVNGTVTQNGGTIDTYNPTTFTNAVAVNGGVLTSHETQTVFAAGLSVGANGKFNNDPGMAVMTSLNVAPGGVVQGGQGALFQDSGDVTNNSATGFQLSTSKLELTSGGTNSHTFNWTVNSGFTDIGNLTIDSGQKVDFENVGNSDAALYTLSFQLADGLDAANPTALESDISTALSGDLTIYYDPNASDDSYLKGMTYTFGTGGILEAEAVPEPSTWVLFLGSLAILLIGGKRLSRSKKQNYRRLATPLR
jgi:hypothetical protein